MFETSKSDTLSDTGGVRFTEALCGQSHGQYFFFLIIWNSLVVNVLSKKIKPCHLSQKIGVTHKSKRWPENIKIRLSFVYRSFNEHFKNRIETARRCLNPNDCITFLSRLNIQNIQSFMLECNWVNINALNTTKYFLLFC